MLEFKKPARTSRGAYTHHDMYVIVLHDTVTNEIGVGELAPLPDLSCDKDAYSDITSITQLVDKAIMYMQRYDGEWPTDMQHLPSLRFAIESAWTRVYHPDNTFSTPFARGECGIPFNGLVWMDNYDNMLQQMQEKIDAGFKCIKLKIGAIEWQKELNLIRVIREHYGKDCIEIRVDANGGFEYEVAMNRMETLAKYDIHSIEQPIQPAWRSGKRSLLPMAELCCKTPLPIALDEELIGVNDSLAKEELLDIINPQYIVLKPTLHGGLSGVHEWISMAKKRNIGSWITSALESNVGLQAVSLLAAREYGTNISFPQGLGTGQLFVKNIGCPDIVSDFCKEKIVPEIELRGTQIWIRR